MKKLSVIVPCYNEEAVLPAFYEAITKVAASCSAYDFELLFVNDGSRDNTQNIIEEVIKICSPLYMKCLRIYNEETSNTSRAIT